MIRRWQVLPDIEFPTREGLIPVVSRGAQVEAVLDAMSMVDRAGGGFSVVAGRAPTGMEGEMVTTGLIVEWRSRTDAKSVPESHTEVLPETYEEPDDPADDPTLHAVASSDIGDGLDESLLPEEDESALEGAR